MLGGRAGGGRVPENFEKNRRARKPNLRRETQTRRNRQKGSSRPCPAVGRLRGGRLDGGLLRRRPQGGHPRDRGRSAARRGRRIRGPLPGPRKAPRVFFQVHPPRGDERVFRPERRRPAHREERGYGGRVSGVGSPGRSKPVRRFGNVRRGRLRQTGSRPRPATASCKPPIARRGGPATQAEQGPRCPKTGDNPPVRNPATRPSPKNDPLEFLEKTPNAGGRAPKILKKNRRTRKPNLSRETQTKPR